MKIRVFGLKRLSVTVMIATVFALMITGIPYAMANPSPAVNGISTVQNANAAVSITGGGPNVPHSGWGIYVIDHDINFGAIGMAGTCMPPLFAPPVPGGVGPGGTDTGAIYEFRNPAGALRIGYTAPVGGNLNIPYGTPTGVLATGTATAGASWTLETGGLYSNVFTPIVLAGPPFLVPGSWFQINVGAVGAFVPNTARIGGYFVGSCGTEPNNPNFVGTGGFQVAAPVGGEVNPISMTSLLIAGFTTNPLWLLPLVAVAGGAFAILRFQVNRKN